MERARDEVRKRIAAGLDEPVVVILHAGTYELSACLTFGPEDSGTEAFPVTYAAAPDEVVVLSGGRGITGWTEKEPGLWTAELPKVEWGDRFFRQLTVDDRRAVRARWPDEDGLLRIATVSDDVKTFTFDRPLPGGDLAEDGAELVVYENWSITRGLVTACEKKGVATATAMGWIGHGPYTTASPGKPAFLEHSRRFLDRPGEWFLDREANVLHYLPREGEKLEVIPVVAPRLRKLVAIHGTRDEPVRHLHFKGIRFEHVDFDIPKVGYNEIQASHYGTTTKKRCYVHPVAIECVHAEACRFESCRFAHINCSGIGFGPGCRNNAVLGCDIMDIGGSGVMIGWRGIGALATDRLDADWRDPSLAPAGNEVTHCHIRRCGEDSRGSVGIFAAFSADTRIAHNLIHDMPYTGISIGFRWNTTPSSQVRCLVEYNHIHDVMKKLADGGGIYTLGFQPGTILRGNHIHDVHRSAFAHGGAPNNGFFIDEGSKGFLFESNVVYRTSGDPVRFNQCRKEWHDWVGNHLGNEEVAPGE